MLQANAQLQPESRRIENDETAVLAGIAALVHADIAEGEFYGQVLEICLRECAATAGCIWLLSGDELFVCSHSPGAMQLLHPDTDIERRHLDLVKQAISRRNISQLGPRNAIEACDDLHNPTAHSLTLIPVATGRRSVGLIELIAVDPSAQVSSRFLSATVELVAIYADEQRGRRIEQQNVVLRQTQSFVELLQIHSDLHSTCLTIANEGRSLIRCNRLSICVKQGSRFRVMAISGQDVIDRRAPAIQSLEILANQTIANSQFGPSAAVEISRKDLANRPEYLQFSSANVLTVVPLALDHDRIVHSSIDGVLIAEWFSGESPTNEAVVKTVTRHSALALRNAVELAEQRFPRLFCRRKSKRSRAFGPVLVASLVVLAGFLIPVQFCVEGRGELQPETRRNIFASRDGVVSQLLIRDAAEVHRDQPLLELRDSSLDLELSRVTGEIQTATQKLAVLNASLVLTGRERQRIDEQKMAGESEELNQYLQGLETQRDILLAEQRKLTLRSPMAGVALTWNLHQRLNARPVKRGDSLVTIADTRGAWILELLVADDDFGPIRDASRHSETGLNVGFRISTHPGRTFRGSVQSIGNTTEVDEILGPVVRVIVSVDRNELPDLRPGTTVIAKIECGRKPIGYAWLHDMIDPIRAMFVF